MKDVRRRAGVALLVAAMSGVVALAAVTVVGSGSAGGRVADITWERPQEQPVADITWEMRIIPPGHRGM